MTRRDHLTPDLFEVPRAVAPVPGSMDYRPVVTGMVGAMLDAASRAGKDRYQVAAEISRLADREVSKYMLDAYSAPSRDDYNIPAWLVPLLETVCDCFDFCAWHAELRGGRLLVGKDALAGELGRLERQRDELAGQVKAIKEQLRRVR